MYNVLHSHNFQVVGGTEITKWRTAAASAVATKHLKPKEFQVLAILGAGVQGRIHAICFNHFYDFKEVFLLFFF